MEIQLYNLYWGETLVLRNATAGEVNERVGKRIKIAYYADLDVRIAGRWRVERSYLQEDAKSIERKKNMLLDWEQLIAPFKKVIWVTMVDRNTKVLRIKK